MTKNRTPTPVYLDPGMHSGLEVKGLMRVSAFLFDNISKNKQKYDLNISDNFIYFQQGVKYEKYSYKLSSQVCL